MLLINDYFHCICHNCFCSYPVFDFLVLKNFYIVWLYNPLTLSVPDDGYSRTASCALN